MATMKIKTTYSLDVETVQALESMARRWKVSKSEALRRAIRAASSAAGDDDALRAWDEFQRSVAVGRRAAARWQDEADAERKAWARRRESSDG